MIEKIKPYVIVEGGSGCGKTTVIKGLKKEMAGWEFVREPGGTEYGNAVRDAVQQHSEWEIHPIAAMFGYSASRANLIYTKILPIVMGQIPDVKGVVSDRSWFTTDTYQGAGEGVDRSIIYTVSQIATGGLEPSLVLHYDLLPELAMERKTGCSDIDRFDMKELEFHRRAREAYLELAEKYKDNWRVIDASKSKEEVLADSLAALKEFGLI